MLGLHTRIPTRWVNVHTVIVYAGSGAMPLSFSLSLFLYWFTHEVLDPCCFCLLIITYLLNHQLILPRHSQSGKQQEHLEPCFVPYCVLCQYGVMACLQSFLGSSDVLWTLLRRYHKILCRLCEIWWERCVVQIEQFGRSIQYQLCMMDNIEDTDC